MQMHVEVDVESGKGYYFLLYYHMLYIERRPQYNGTCRIQIWKVYMQNPSTSTESKRVQSTRTLCILVVFFLLILFFLSISQQFVNVRL